MTLPGPNSRAGTGRSPTGRAEADVAQPWRIHHLILEPVLGNGGHNAGFGRALKLPKQVPV